MTHVKKGPAPVRELVIKYRRNPDYRPRPHQNIRSPEDATYIFPELYEADLEQFMAVYLNGRNQVKAWSHVAEGTSNQAVPYISTILRGPLLSNAASLIVVHCHPSGHTTSSREDKRFTGALKMACEALDIKLFDHVVVGETPDGEKHFFSFAEGGLI